MDIKFMKEALRMAKKAEAIDETPIGAVIVRDGKVFVPEADCPDKLCGKSEISKSGSSIVCLPNHLSVIIEGGKKDEKIDVIV